MAIEFDTDKYPTPVMHKPSISWALEAMHIPALWAKGYSGKGVSIGHLDTGICSTAKDLLSRVKIRVFFDKAGVLEEEHPGFDDTGHGTQTASLLVGSSRGRMLIGAAPQASLISAKVLEGGMSVLRILKGLVWLGEQQVPVVLLCAGLPNTNPVFGPIMRSLRSRGTLVVCPIGNAGNGHYYQPGDDPSVLSVGAVDSYGEVPQFSGSRLGRFSNQVLAPDVLAPGVAVSTATLHGGRAQVRGTSMAAALVAGVAALLKEAVPGATAEGLIQAICKSTEPLNQKAHKCSRYGMVRADLALENLLNAAPNTKLVEVKRPSLVDAGWKDPRLVYQVAQASTSKAITAIYILQTDLPTDTWESRIREQFRALEKRHTFHATEFLPSARAVVVTALPDTHAFLMREGRITYASATDAGCTMMPN